MPESETSEGGSGFRRTPGKQLYDMTEHELVSEILFGSARLYEFFGFVMTDVHGLIVGRELMLDSFRDEAAICQDRRLDRLH